MRSAGFSKNIVLGHPTTKIIVTLGLDQLVSDPYYTTVPAVPCYLVQPGVLFSGNSAADYSANIAINTGTNTIATVLSNLMTVFSAGPAVSL